MTTAPLIVNYGGGVDSTAILVGFQAKGVRPDLIIFSDVGSEKPETYLYLDRIDSWLVERGFPMVTRVKRYDLIGRRGTTYETIYENCITNETLPSIAFGFRRHSCSIKWKAEVITKYIRAWQPAVDAFEAGLRPVQCIGYDASDSDMKRRKRADSYGSTDKHRCPTEMRYPLQEWGWDRDECRRQIQGAGLPIPKKSACFFCPASKTWEIAELAATNPALLMQAFEMERLHLTGKHSHKNSTCLGLGFTFSWTQWCAEQGILTDGRINRDRAMQVRNELNPLDTLESRGCPATFTQLTFENHNREETS
tara:strand:+ start:79 stop:1005 length:927 start_codon:yes stop_codon:yes gene_type:complete